MNTGAHRHLVTLDTPNGESGGFLPLDPPDWWCAYVSEPAGQATLIGPYHPGISTDTRVHFKGRVYHVDGVTNVEERDRQLVVSISEVFA